MEWEYIGELTLKIRENPRINGIGGSEISRQSMSKIAHRLGNRRMCIG
jgi:hypothetical protein